MASQKKTSSKKTGKSSKSSKKDDFSPSENGFGSILGGWTLVGLGIILMLGCICSAYSGVKENVLGPYLGKLFPEALAFVFGRVASLIVSSALVLWGATLVSVTRRARFIRYAVGLFVPFLSQKLWRGKGLERSFDSKWWSPRTVL